MIETTPGKETIETLRLLYPIFKGEVYRRRAAIARITRRASLLYVFLSVIAILFPAKNPIPIGLKLLAGGGIALSIVLLTYQIFQEKSRHEKAKLQLIALEKGFGFFDEGSYLPNERLYPADWQNRPPIDQGMMVSIATVIGTGIVLILVILWM
ncbi:MAG: hypothetical protein ACE5GK_12045 [Nitrospiria bacterium]